MEHRQEIERLTAAIEASPEDMTLYAERGKIHFKMINEILEFRYNDIYNP